jgi:DNA-directed RNA polymerase specialized sigma24 family protein
MAEITQYISMIEALPLDQDMRQDLYVSLLELDELPAFENDNRAQAYFVISARHIRANNTWKLTNRKRLEGRAADIMEGWVGNDNNDPFDYLTAEDMVRRVGGLSDILYNTVYYIYIDGLTPDEVAEANGENVDAVYKRIERAKKFIQGE